MALVDTIFSRAACILEEESRSRKPTRHVTHVSRLHVLWIDHEMTNSTKTSPVTPMTSHFLIIYFPPLYIR